MKTSLLLAALCGTLLTATASYAQDPDKMTYEKAMESHQAANQQYRDQSVTREESQLAWDTYAQEPEEAGTGAVPRTYTTIFSNSSGLGRGNFVLSQPYSDFDYIEVWGAHDNGSQGAVVRWTPEQLDYYNLVTTKTKTVTLYYSDNEYWTGRFSSDKKTFITADEGALLYKIMGVNW